MPDTPPRATLSVAIITFNEEENIGRTLASVKSIADEIIVVDSGSTDRTVEIANQFGAKVFIEEWKGFAVQKNSALDKCTSEWILSLDADEEVDEWLNRSMQTFLRAALRQDEIFREHGFDQCDLFDPLVVDLGLRFGLEDYWRKEPHLVNAASFPRANFFLGRRLKHGGQYPDRKVRFIRKGSGRFEDRRVHEDLRVVGVVGTLHGDLIHHQYPTLTAYIEHMNRYSSLGAEMVIERRGRVGFSVLNILVRPLATFIYNYFFRLGFLDGKEGLLLHLYHSVYVSWKYAKAWELSRKRSSATQSEPK